MQKMQEQGEMERFETEREREISNQFVFLNFPLQGSILFAAICPLVGAIICISMTLTVHKDIALNDTWVCDSGQHLPTISTCIGGFTPQKYVWTLMVILHFPIRIYFGYAYEILFLNSKESRAQGKSYKNTTKAMNFAYMTGIGGLILLTAVDSGFFALHAFGFIIWLFASCIYMILNTILHHLSGWRKSSKTAEMMFWIKVSTALMQITLTVVVFLTYPLYIKHCQPWIHTAFTISEYLIVFLDILFNIYPYFDFPHLKLCLSIDFSSLYQAL